MSLHNKKICYNRIGDNMKKKICLLVIAVFSLFLFTGCNKKTDSEVVKFSYNYGSYNGGYYEYAINKEGKKVIYTARGMNGVSLNKNKEISKSYLKKLTKVIDKNGIVIWNGFNKSNNGVLDGYGFSLNVEYANGEKITAHGYMDYPSGYKKGHKALTKFLESIK